MSALQLGRVWASAPTNPNIDPGADKYALGWLAEIPVFEMLNYINNRHDTNIVSQAERGVFEWGGDVTYKVAAITWDEADGFIYISKVANPNTALRPGLNAAQWDKSAVQISRKQYDDAVAAWANHIANTSNPHQLTVDILNTYSKAIIDGKVGVVQSNLNTHTSNVSNIHGVTATQVGAVPVTGGSYTGLVKHLFASTGIGASSYAASLLTDATGVFLALGTNSKIGLDSTNKAVFVDDVGVKSNILIASDYIAAREAVEASYVPPTPDCELQLRNSIALIHGFGSATFTGPAGSRGYLDKSGVAQTAALNTPRYTASGLYVTNNVDAESLNLPTVNNILGAPSFTWCLGFKSTATSTSSVFYYLTGGLVSGLTIASGKYRFRSVVGGVQTTFDIAAVDHSISHKLVVVSDATLNKTFVYLDGVLKIAINSKQDVFDGTTLAFSSSVLANGATYYDSFRTWLSALPAQQIYNL